MQGAQYFHWVVANIPGLDLGAGAEVMEYIPPFQVDGLLKSNIVQITQASTSDPPHPMLFLVYQQPGPIIVMETQQVQQPNIQKAYNVRIEPKIWISSLKTLTNKPLLT